MANENTCIRCGKPCASGEVMCASCNKWLNENSAAEKAAEDGEKKSPPAVKHCVHCDGMIPAMAEFCSHCGKSQKAEVKPAAAPAPAAKPVQQPVQQPKTAQPKEKKSGQRGLIIGLSVLIVVLLAALAIILVLSLKDLNPGEAGADGQESAGTGTFEPGSGIVVPEQGTVSGTEQEPEEETADPGTEPEQDAEEPVAVACKSCGVAITTEDAVCPYCGWDQSVEPEEEPAGPLTATVGYTDAIEDWATVTVVSTSETSVVSQSGTYDNTAASVVDDDLATSWQEGKDGYGIGESIQLDFDGMHQIRGIALWLGNWRSDSLYAENCVPKMLNIYIDEQVVTVEFPQEKTCQYVVFSEPVPADFVMIEISSVYAGSKYDDTCIAEVMVYADPE